MRARLESLLLDQSRTKDAVAVLLLVAMVGGAGYLQAGIWKADIACPERVGAYCPTSGR